MVYESGEVSTLGGVNYGLSVNPEEIRTADALSLVLNLSQVGQHRPHHLADILDHHFISCNRLKRKQTPVMNGRFGKFQLFFAELKKKTTYTSVKIQTGLRFLYLELVELEEVGVGVHAEGIEQSALVAAGLPADVLHLGRLGQHVRVHHRLDRLHLLATKVVFCAQLLNTVNFIKALSAGAATFVQPVLLSAPLLGSARSQIHICQCAAVKEKWLIIMTTTNSKFLIII